MVVLPGIVTTQENGTRTYQPIRTRIKSIRTESKQLEYAIPGGLIGVELDIEPALAKRDLLAGDTLGIEGHLPPCWKEMEIRYELMRRFINEETNQRIAPVGQKEVLEIHIGAAYSLGRVQ